MRTRWNYSERKKLEMLLKNGFKPFKIIEVMDISRTTLLNEIKKGITEEEYKDQRYVMYSVKRAILSEIRATYDKETLALLKEALNEDDGDIDG